MNDFKNFEDILADINELKDSNPYSDILLNSFKGIEHFEEEKRRQSESSIRIINDLKPGMVEAGKLSKMIHGLQSTVEGAFNYIFGNNSSQGKIPNQYSEKAKLVVTALSQGSFVISLDTKSNIDKYEQTSLFDENTDELKNIVDDLLNDISSIEDYEQITNFVEKYGVRTFNRSKSWINSVKNTEFEYKRFKTNDKVIFNSEKVHNLSDLMSQLNLKTESEKIKITGKLIMINNKLSKLTFETDNDEITLKVLDDSIKDLNLITNNVYNIEVRKTTTKFNVGKETVEYAIQTLYGTELDNKH